MESDLLNCKNGEKLTLDFSPHETYSAKFVLPFPQTSG